MKFIASCFQFLARAAIASVFIMGGFYLLMFASDDTLLKIQTHYPSCPYLPIIGPLVIIAGMLGALMFMFDIFPKVMAVLLALLTLVIIYVLDAFWNSPVLSLKDPAIVEFFKNVAIFGALLLFIATPSTHSSPKKKEKEE